MSASRSSCSDDGCACVSCTRAAPPAPWRRHASAKASDVSLELFTLSASGRGGVRLNVTRGDDGRRRALGGSSRLDGLRRRRSRASERAERDRPAPEREDEGEREAQAEEEEFGPAVRDLRAREEDEVGHEREDEEADDVDEDRLRGEGARDDAMDSLERERKSA